jgi:RNA polymerase sigma-70 factor (ECF subfamily)
MSEERSQREQVHEMQTGVLLEAWVTAQDEGAFEALFYRHYPGVHRLLYRLVGDEADDLAQQVFMRLHDRPPRAAGSETGAWLYRVATRLGYNALRARARYARYGDAAARAESSGGPTDPAELVEREQERAHVRAALARLNHRQAALLVLRAEERSYREIAAIVGVRPGSVGTLLARAEAAFARAYERVDHAPGVSEQGGAS